jgi:hypothetical protein
MDEPGVLETAKRRYRDEIDESVTAIRIVSSVYEAVVEVDDEGETGRVASRSQSKADANCGVIFYVLWYIAVSSPPSIFLQIFSTTNTLQM